MPPKPSTHTEGTSVKVIGMLPQLVGLIPAEHACMCETRRVFMKSETFPQKNRLLNKWISNSLYIGASIAASRCFKWYMKNKKLYSLNICIKLIFKKSTQIKKLWTCKFHWSRIILALMPCRIASNGYRYRQERSGNIRSLEKVSPSVAVRKSARKVDGLAGAQTVHYVQNSTFCLQVLSNFVTPMWLGVWKLRSGN
jgi:hypothetical protein